MNINFVCIARTADSERRLEKLFHSAVDEAERIFPNSDGTRWIDANVGVYNANGVTGTWTPPTWFESGSDLIAVSQPPIPVDTICQTHNYWKSVAEIAFSGGYSRFLPNHFGIIKHGSSNVKIWSDALGVGRCYYVWNSEFIAASNHIGILAYFLQEPVQLDVEAVSRYAHTEWFTFNDSPIKGVRRLGPGSVIDVQFSGAAEIYEYHALKNLVGARNLAPDYRGVVNELRTVARNLDNLTVKTPSVMLSGGRDSRMTASIWLSSGNRARVVTRGALETEAEVAGILMKQFLSNPNRHEDVQHVITHPKAASITMSLPDRLERAFSMWDGDAAPINLRTNIAIPSGKSALSIGGAGGEITHGYYYGHLKSFDSATVGTNPMEHARRNYRMNSVSEFAKQSMEDYFDIMYEKSRRDSRTDIRALDYLYLNEKFRRWGNQALGSTSAILLSSPAHVRASFDLSPEGHLEKALPTALVEQAIPSWSQVPYYKASRADSKASMRKKLSTFDTDPEYFFSALHDSEVWPQYLDASVVNQALATVESGDASPSHESLLNRAIWIDYMKKHVEELRQKVALANESNRESIEIHGYSFADIYTDELQKGFFSPRQGDAVLASQITSGHLPVGGVNVSIFETSAYESSCILSRGDQLYLHTLRWVDALRRSTTDNSEAAGHWESVLQTWASSETAQDEYSIAWSLPVLLQRSTAIALGMLAEFKVGDLAPLHLRRLQEKAAQEKDGGRRLKILTVELALMDQLALSQGQIKDYVSNVAAQIFDESGYVSGSDWSEILQTKSRWQELLVKLGVARDHEAVRRAHSTEFWVHALSPAGSIIPLGSDLPELNPFPHDQAISYVLSRGTEGAPPEAVRCAISDGPVYLHSGWGETERNVEEETAVSLVLGPVRGRNSHSDVSRVTFSSQGRDWLVDPAVDDMSGPEMHSTLYVEGQRYRPAGEAQLTREYSDGDVDGFVVNNTVLLPVQWRRHVVFARTGNYMVVSDVARSSDPIKGYQQWIVAPDVEIEQQRGGYLLRSGQSAVRLSIFSRDSRESLVEPIRDDQDELLAWRIRVPLSGKNSRSTVVISDYDMEQECPSPELKYYGNEFAVTYRTPRLSEILAVTPERSAVYPSELDPEKCISLAIERAASGDLDEQAVLAQRLAVRTRINTVKRRLWESQGCIEQRKSAIDELSSFAREAKVGGLRDHGLGAAMRDIAGTDLTEYLGSRATSSGDRRSPLVSWTNDDMIQPSYGVPVRTSTASNEVPSNMSRPFIWSVDHGQLVASSYVAGVSGPTLTVYFHGATDRSRFTLPRYERLNSMGKLESGPLMFFSDPTLDLDSRMILSWFVGTEDVNMHREIATMVCSYAESAEVDDVLLVGNSGGAFTALQVASYLSGSFVISFNPQIQIDEYVQRMSKTAHWSSFGRGTVSDDPVTSYRMDLIKRYQDIEFEQDVVLIQNPGDDQHFQDHFKPFVAAYESSGKDSRLKTYTPDLGPGHRVPSVPEYMKYVSTELDSILGKKRFGGMR